MKLLLALVACLALLAGIVLAVGSSLPKDHRATSVVRLEASPDSVWAVIRDLEAVPSWWPEIKTASRLADRDGEERYLHTMGDGFAMTLVVKESVPPHRLRTAIEASADADFGGGWLYQLRPDGTGTEVSLTEDGWIANRMFRVVAWATGYHRTIDDHLRALGRRFGAPVRPEHLGADKADRR